MLTMCKSVTGGYTAEGEGGYWVTPQPGGDTQVRFPPFEGDIGIYSS